MEQDQKQKETELVIRFGPDADSQEVVENVKVNFVGQHSAFQVMTSEPDLDVRKKYTDFFDYVSILKSCNELYLTFKKDKKNIGELYLPMHVIGGIVVDYKNEKEDKSN